MRAEVALLSRNVLIYGEMEDSCYGHLCQYYNYDTFGGHIKVRLWMRGVLFKIHFKFELLDFFS